MIEIQKNERRDAVSLMAALHIIKNRPPSVGSTYVNHEDAELPFLIGIDEAEERLKLLIPRLKAERK